MRRMRRSPSSPPYLQLASASTLASSSSEQDPSSHQETTRSVGHQHDLSERLLDSPSLGYCPPESSSPPAPAPPAWPSPASSLAHTASHNPPPHPHLPPPRAP